MLVAADLGAQGGDRVHRVSATADDARIDIASSAAPPTAMSRSPMLKTLAAGIQAGTAKMSPRKLRCVPAPITAELLSVSPL